VTSDGTLVVNGHGGTLGDILLQQLAINYASVTSFVQFDYIDIGDPVAGRQSISDPATDDPIWSTAEAPLSQQEYAQNLEPYPLFGAAIVIIYR
jgi:hypothetical protein